MFGFFKNKKKPPATKAKAETEKPAAAKPQGKGKTAAKPPAAPAKAEAKPAPKPEPVSAGDSLERAKAKLATKGAGGRAALIEQAMAVHQQQAKKLDSLPEETRMRLRAMALKAFVLPGEKKDKSKLN
jgi:hypothetical protein